ncbi:uncharacterized protein JCM10292_001727 [Rhodotorula paludigena]|uniref:uncharacterized protein n=1 Tax=Rhodotorula paludigena TaxID=86838 RepID=UPI003180117D
MASFFNRPSYTASWQQRIYPIQGEPSFAPPVPSARPDAAAASPPLSPASHRNSRPSPASHSSAGPASPAPAVTPRREAPPPIYYPGPARRTAAAAHDSAGLAPSTNTASTATCTVDWAYHPCAPDAHGGRGMWGQRLRLGEIARAIKGQPEKLWDGWPAAFGGTERVAWRVAASDAEAAHGADGGEGDASAARTRSRSLSLAHSRRDSGVALTVRSTAEPTHPLEPLYRKRIAELNALLEEHLVPARIWLALLELLCYVWVVALVVALAQGGGEQTGFLKGVELALILVILVAGLALNGVRMRRYALARALKLRTRDWSPLPLTSSTNAGLMRNYLDGDAERGRTESMAPKEGPVLRWRMRQTEGSYWLSYRPVIRVELVTPSSFHHRSALAYLPVVDAELGAPPAVDGSQPEGDARPAAGGEAGEASTGLPPRYEDA